MAEQANYQGEHLGLSLNRDAVFALNDALEQLRYSVDNRTSAAVPLRLPDGRTLQLRLSLNNAGEIRDANGDYLDDDGKPHGDVTGDLAAHFEARQVLDAAARPSLLFELTDEQLDGTEPVALDQIAARRAAAAAEALPYRPGRTDDWVQRLRTRAVTHARTVLPEVLEREQRIRRQVLADREQPAARTQAEADTPTQPDESAPDRADTPIDAVPPALRSPARPRNRFDDDRRRMTGNARFTRGVAQEQTQLGDAAGGARWARVADGWDHAALGYRRQATAEPELSRLRAEVAELDADRGRDTGRTAGSDGLSGGAGMAM